MLDYLRKNVWAQVAGFVGFLAFMVGGVNDAASLFSAIWMPKWLPGVMGSALLYAAFQVLGYRLHKSAERVEALVALFPASSAQSSEPKAPKKRPGEAYSQSKWVPDMTLSEAAKYVSSKSTWRPSYNSRDIDAELTNAIREAAYAGQITAWGREHPESEEYQLWSDVWEHGADIRLRESYAFFKRAGVPTHKIRLARGEVEAAWPPKR